MLQALKLNIRYCTLPQAYSIYFKVDGLKVQYTGPEYNPTQYIFNLPINHNQSVKFKLRITRAIKNDITVGVVDYAKQKDEKYSYNLQLRKCNGLLF